MRRTALVLVATALTLNAPTAVAGGSGLVYHKVALTGEPAPGTEPGTNFQFFTTGLNHWIMAPQIDEHGRVAFIALVSGPGVNTTNRSGIWGENSGSLDLLVRTGMHAPGTPTGVVFAGVPSEYIPFPPSFGGGRAAFQGLLTGPGVSSANDDGFWTADASGIALVAREGNLAPGMPHGVNFSLVGGDIDAQGDVGVTADLSGSGVGQQNDDSLWSDRSGSLVKIAREAEPVPGMPSGVVFGSGNLGAAYTFNQVAFNDDSRLAVQANFVGQGIDSFNDEGIFVERDGQLTLVARDGDPAPGYDNGGYFGGGSVSAHFYSLVHNARGHVAFQADVGEPEWRDHVIYSDRSGSLELVARNGDPIPGTDDTLTIFGGPALNDEDRIAFVGSVETGSYPPFGVFSDRAGTLAPVVMPGDVLDGMSVLGSAGIVGFNAAGDLAFLLDFDHPQAGFKAGLVLADRNGTLRIVAATGDLFDVQGDGSDLREVVRLVAGGLSETGVVAFRLDFSDNASGHFSAAIPRAGAVSDLLVAKSGGSLELSWQPDCAGSSSAAIYRGDLDTGLASLAPEPGQCAVSGTSATIPQGSGTRDFFLVVPNTGDVEGSYGVDSAGEQHPVSSSACFPQGIIDTCAE